MGEQEEAPTMFSVAALVSTTRRILKLLNRAVPKASLVLGVCACCEGFAAVGLPFVTKQLVDSVELARRGALVRAAVAWLAVEFGLSLVRVAAQRGSEYIRYLLEARGSLFLQKQVLDKAHAVAYQRFEQSAFLNRLSRAREDASFQSIIFVVQVFRTLTTSLIFVGCMGLLILQSPWSLPVLLLSALPSFLSEVAIARRAFRLENAHVDRNRKGWHLEWLLSAESTAKEIRALGIGPWLLALYDGIHTPFREGQAKLAAQHLWRSGLANLLGLLGLYGPYLYVVLRTAQGRTTLGGMLLFVMAFQQGSAGLGQLFNALAAAVSKEFYVRNLLTFLDEDVTIEANVGLEPVLAEAPELGLNDIWFTYPGATEPVFRGLNLSVRPGETLALVGANGVGKTTLVKIILGLYEVERGSITLNGQDVALKSTAWRRKNIAVVFQDFARFQFSVRENVGVGWLPAAEDEARIRRALDMADATRMVDQLPQGLRSSLGTAFGGSDLSGGQWQRIALARLFMRESRLWILDEPTAAMDPETEEKTFRRFQDWSGGRTAVIISHRFSTVRMADRIAVIRDGGVSEIGTHDDLMARGGEYAQMFAPQQMARAV